MLISFHTLGCKVNQYETEILAQRFAEQGFQKEDGPHADVIVINSCTVTASGDKKTRQLLHRLRRENPSAIIALTGCFPQAFPHEASALQEADVITGAKNRSELPALVRRALGGERPIVSIIPHEKGEAFEEMSSAGMERTRAFLKIEDGCNHHCTYCIIPTARGPVRSKPLDNLQTELQALAASGHKEVVLAGINLASYGRDSGSSLLEAVRIACAVPGLVRVRLGSMEADLLSDSDWQALAALPQLCPQFHLSLQSGSDATLRRMGRKYNTDYYRHTVQTIRSVFPNPSITTDIMVGFPGETEADFEDSLRFFEETGFAGAHVFAYSPRPGTPAASFAGQVPSAEKNRRSRLMQQAADRMKEQFLQGMVGRTEEILVEYSSDPAKQEGYTPNYTNIRISHPQLLRRQLVRVLIAGIEQNECYGYIV